MNEDAFEVPERNEYRYLVQEEEEDEVQYVRHRHYINPLLVLSRRCIFLICLGVLALLSLAAYLGYIAQTLPPGLAVVTTRCGEFRGRHVSLKPDVKSQCAHISPVQSSSRARLGVDVLVCSGSLQILLRCSDLVSVLPPSYRRSI